MKSICNFDWQLFLEFLKVFLSWPPVALGILLVVLLNFKKSIKSWLENLQIKYGDATFSSLQASKGEKEIVLSGSQPEVSSEGHSFKPQDSPDPSYETLLEGKPQEELKNLVVQWRANAYLWEYKYLNSYLVPHTQIFLDWLYEAGKPVLLDFADNYWKPIITLPKERVAVVSALENHSLLQIVDNCLVITEKGKEYVEIMGKNITNALKKSLNANGNN